jgi:hypothetical protein
VQKFSKNILFDDFFYFSKGYLVDFFWNFWDTLGLGYMGEILWHCLATSDPWVGFLKFCLLDILEFAWLHAVGSGLTEKNTRNLKSPNLFLLCSDS